MSLINDALKDARNQNKAPEEAGTDSEAAPFIAQSHTAGGHHRHGGRPSPGGGSPWPILFAGVVLLLLAGGIAYYLVTTGKDVRSEQSDENQQVAVTENGKEEQEQSGANSSVKTDDGSESQQAQKDEVSGPEHPAEANETPGGDDQAVVGTDASKSGADEGSEDTAEADEADETTEVAKATVGADESAKTTDSNVESTSATHDKVAKIAPDALRKKYRISGIMHSGSKSLVIVNGRIISEGKSLDQKTVVKKVYPNYIIVEYQDERFRMPKP